MGSLLKIIKRNLRLIPIDSRPERRETTYSHLLIFYVDERHLNFRIINKHMLDNINYYIIL